jgi:hypothetical protein
MDMIQKIGNKYYITLILLQSRILKNITKYTLKKYNKIYYFKKSITKSYEKQPRMAQRRGPKG